MSTIEGKEARKVEWVMVVRGEERVGIEEVEEESAKSFSSMVEERVVDAERLEREEEEQSVVWVVACPLLKEKEEVDFPLFLFWCLLQGPWSRCLTPLQQYHYYFLFWEEKIPAI